MYTVHFIILFTIDECMCTVLHTHKRKSTHVVKVYQTDKYVPKLCYLEEVSLLEEKRYQRRLCF